MFDEPCDVNCAFSKHTNWSFPKLQLQRKQKNSLLTTFFGISSLRGHGINIPLKKREKNSWMPFQLYHSSLLADHDTITDRLLAYSNKQERKCRLCLADVREGEMNAWRTNPTGRLRGGYVNSGTEVLMENVCFKWHVLQTYCFPSNEDWLHTEKNFDTNIYYYQKCELISLKVIDYKHNIYNRDLFLFYFYTFQCKNLYPDLPVFFSPCN